MKGSRLRDVSKACPSSMAKKTIAVTHWKSTLCNICRRQGVPNRSELVRKALPSMELAFLQSTQSMDMAFLGHCTMRPPWLETISARILLSPAKLPFFMLLFTVITKSANIGVCMNLIKYSTFSMDMVI